MEDSAKCFKIQVCSLFVTFDSPLMRAIQPKEQPSGYDGHGDASTLDTLNHMQFLG